MKVVHVAAYFAPAWEYGGPPRSMLALCQAQRAAGIDAEVFTTTATGEGELPAHCDGIVFEGVPVRYFPRGNPKWLLASAAMWRPLRAALERADVAHLHGLFNGTVWMAGLLARNRVPYVISPRGMLQDAALGHHLWRKRAAWQLFDRSAFHHAALWHATSPFEADALRSNGTTPVVEIPNAVAERVVPPDLAEEAQRALGIPSDPYVVFLGRLHPIKRLDLLIDAFATVAREIPAARLVIAGPDETGQRSALAARVAPLGARVQWTGQVDGAVKTGLLAGSRALVLCSDSESFGMSVAEAMAAGVPVVVTRSCPWPIVEVEGCGFWIEQSPDAIANALVTLLRHPKAAREMGRRGQAVIHRDFAPAAVAERWVSAYESVARAADRASVAPSA